MQKIRIILSTTTGGELDRQKIDVHDDDDTAEISHAIIEALEAWTLSPGDIIRIEEV